MMEKKVGIIQFPGSNCEYETQAACHLVGIDADILAWNAEPEKIENYAGYILPGGFSFQDRIRAGVVSSKLPIMAVIKQQADLGKPVLGICNGCQILAELGLIESSAETGSSSVALAPNIKNDQFNGFICDWVYVKVKCPQESLFTRYFKQDLILPIQINHGEGNFKFIDQQVNLKHRTAFVYCDEQGHELDSFPVNPNGSDFNLAGLCNDKGNVLAMMPHPERGVSWFQVPSYMQNEFSDQKRKNSLKQGPWIVLFQGLFDGIKGN